MTRAQKTGIIGSTAFVVLAATSLIFLNLSRKPTEVQAQSSSRSSSASVIYSARYINQVMPGQSLDSIQRVYAVPDSPCFIIRTKDALTVWVNNTNGLFRLLEIRLEERLEDLVFLEDNRTFIVHTKSSARVYTINQELVSQSERAR